MSEPRIRPFGRETVLAPTGSEAVEADRRAIEELGVPQRVLMENAGRTAAAVVERLYPRGDVVALVGSGNNGGDALVAIRALAEWGRPVRAIQVADREAEEPLLHGWDLPRSWDSQMSEADWETTSRAGVILDGILGTGLTGAPRDRQAEAIRRANAAGPPVVALDIPSGVDGDRGRVEGDAITAEVTVAFGWPKLGCLLHPGRARAGRLLAFHLGFPPEVEGLATGRVITPTWAAARRPRRRMDTHKNEVGTVLVVAGSHGMAGAAVLCGMAAMRAGAGLVRIASVENNRGTIQTSAPEAVFLDVEDPDATAAALSASTAVVVGPGLGTGAVAEVALQHVLSHPGMPLVLDADGLNLLSQGRPTSLPEVTGSRPVILTPHLGEMRRMTDGDERTLSEDRVTAARRFARDVGAVLLLKGSPSIVAAPDRPVLVDSVGTSDLATGGMGDVLAGAIGAFLAAGCEPAVAAGLGLHTCGRAAARASRGAGLVPRDVIQNLPAAVVEPGPGDTDLGLPGLIFDQDPPR